MCSLYIFMFVNKNSWYYCE